MSKESKTKPLSRQREAELVARYKETGDRRIADVLIEANIKLIYRIANKYKSYNTGAEFDDLVQHGRMGIFKALERFDKSKGVRFISYATWWIRAYMLDRILKDHSIVKLGTTQLQKTVFLWRARLDDDGLAEKLDVDVETVKSVRDRIAASDFYYDDNIPGSTSLTYLDTLVSDKESQDELFAREEMYDDLFSKLRSLQPAMSDREKMIFRYRLASTDPKTFAWLGRHMKISRERVRQIELKLRRRMREHLLQSGFTPPTLIA